MTSTPLSKLTIAIAVVVVILGACAVSASEPTLPMDSRIADAFRWLVVTEAGLFIGFMVLCVSKVAKVKIDKSDILTRPLAGWALCSCLLALFGIFNMLSLLHRPMLDWKTPFVVIAFIIGDYSMYLILIRIRRLLRHATRDGVVVKMTLIDTGGEGPLDTDLDSGHRIIHG